MLWFLPVVQRVVQRSNVFRTTVALLSSAGRQHAPTPTQLATQSRPVVLFSGGNNPASSRLSLLLVG
jgi:hypothetical protein